MWMWRSTVVVGVSASDSRGLTIKTHDLRHQGRPHTQEALSSTEWMQLYFCKHFVSFCFDWVFFLFVLLLFHLFILISVFVGFLYVSGFLFISLSFVCFFKDRKRTKIWVDWEAGVWGGGTGGWETWSKYIVSKNIFFQLKLFLKDAGLDKSKRIFTCMMAYFYGGWHDFIPHC